MMILAIAFAVTHRRCCSACPARRCKDRLVVEAGNAALTIVEVVKYPLSALPAILGMLLGADKGASGCYEECSRCATRLGRDRWHQAILDWVPAEGRIDADHCEVLHAIS